MSARKQFVIPLDAMDEVVALGERSIGTVKHVRADEPYFSGHYPQHPIYPGVFIIEAAIQAARIHPDHGTRHSRLVEVVSTRFLAPVQPGETLEVDCELTAGEVPGEMVAKAVCRTGQTKVANVKLKFQREDHHA